MSTEDEAPFPHDPRFRAGAREFNARHFFEAHEVWEDLWNDLVGEPKLLCQGLIQIAAGYHKLEIGNAAGARKLLERGLLMLRGFRGDSTDALGRVVTAVQADLDLVRAKPTEAWSLVRPPRFEESEGV